MMKWLLLVAVMVCVLAPIHFIFGQIGPKLPIVLESVDTGEEASAVLDALIQKASETGERIFVIARLGNYEKQNSGRNLSRLCEVRAYFTNFRAIPIDEGSSLAPIFAEGPSVKGEGRLEFFIGSKLMVTRKIKRDRTANLSCCGELSKLEQKKRREECLRWKGR